MSKGAGSVSAAGCGVFFVVMMLTAAGQISWIVGGPLMGATILITACIGCCLYNFPKKTPAMAIETYAFSPNMIKEMEEYDRKNQRHVVLPDLRQV
jgi:hypothetical protein